MAFELGLGMSHERKRRSIGRNGNDQNRSKETTESVIGLTARIDAWIKLVNTITKLIRAFVALVSATTLLITALIALITTVLLIWGPR